eukprot:scaffold201935_cov17-Tisochrysis_lutea.AAC.2
MPHAQYVDMLGSLLMAEAYFRVTMPISLTGNRVVHDAPCILGSHVLLPTVWVMQNMPKHKVRDLFVWGFALILAPLLQFRANNTTCHMFSWGIE